ncbi:DUF5360 family protein [Agromyces larvae]|uniref:YvaD family protein n=1 Tax=Agromyces larvae TaxID=2929802 RepID=A0ABY4C2S1_9MICO|nr:DUF5360 family protein [Agromyces larvae]UOE45663.1 YvaD family protein [Agromyces larvae]
MTDLDRGTRLSRRVKSIMLWTDLGFAAYWVATAAGLLSVGGGRMMSDWNWSFLGLDLIAITTGLASIALARAARPAARDLMIVSLALTSAAGLMAVNFWAIRAEFDPVWWIPNLWLLLFPAVALTLLFRTTSASGPASAVARPD